jgi:hypothetical protein
MDDERKIVFELNGPIGTASNLMRDRPASQEVSPDIWDLAKTVIDHSCYILVAASELRPEHRVFDLVLASLLRRAIVTAEAVRVLIEAGLEEASFVSFRTLLDVELNLRLIVSDSSGRMARRFAAYHHLTAKRHGTRILEHPQTRQILMGGAGDLETTIEWTRRWASYLRQSVFDDVRDDATAHRNWHGYDSVEQAFAAVDATDDYRMQYEVFSPFVHASNPEADFDGLSEQGGPALKALPQRDPRITRGRIGGMLLTLCRIVEVYLSARAFKDYPETVEGRDTTTGTTFRTTPLALLQAQILGVLGDPNAGGTEPHQK